MSNANANGASQAHAGTWTAPDNHKERGKPSASANCRERVEPSTLKNTPRAQANTMGQGVAVPIEVKTA